MLNETSWEAFKIQSLTLHVYLGTEIHVLERLGSLYYPTASQKYLREKMKKE